MTLFQQVMGELSTGQRTPVFPEGLEPDDYGLVFVGGELSVHTVIEAYTKGHFPWTGSHPIPWFSPDPRMVLFPEKFRASHSLWKLARQRKFIVRFDTDFRGVMENCAIILRHGKRGTWITDNMIETYCELHELNIAHSVETCDLNGELCGGLYGLTFGCGFFGESMFASVPNTSKLALYALCKALAARQFDFIDCQQVTSHLMRLGAVPLRRREYLNFLRQTLRGKPLHKNWKSFVKPVK